MAIINASSSFLIDMPISMLETTVTQHLFILHHRMAIINASSSLSLSLSLSLMHCVSPCLLLGIDSIIEPLDVALGCLLFDV